MVAYVFLFNWLTQAVNDLTPGYFALKAPVGVGFGITVAGQLMMMFLAMYMIGSLVSGWLNRYLYRRNTKLQVMFAFIVTGIDFFVKFSGVTGTGPNALLIVVMAISAFFMGQGIPTIMGFIARSYPEHITGRVGGLSMGLGLIGGVVGVGAGSAALTKTGNYQASVSIVTIVAILGLLRLCGCEGPGLLPEQTWHVPRDPQPVWKAREWSDSRLNGMIQGEGDAPGSIFIKNCLKVEEILRRKCRISLTGSWNSGRSQSQNRAYRAVHCLNHPNLRRRHHE